MKTPDLLRFAATGRKTVQSRLHSQVLITALPDQTIQQLRPNQDAHLNPFIRASLVAIATVMLEGCQPEKPSSGSFPANVPLVQDPLPRLTQAEVLAKFRERASADELRDFNRLSGAADENSRTRATEMVLFKLTGEELSKVGIGQWPVGNGTGELWRVAVEYQASSESQLAFKRALERAGVEPAASLCSGVVGWFVAREDFFKARQALLSARLRTNEIRIIEPWFQLDGAVHKGP